MSVLGLDFGTTNCIIAAAQRGGVDILANEASSRQTGSLVSFGEKQRFVGEAAVAVQMANLNNTIGNVKQMLGRKWSDPYVQANLKSWGICNKFTELPNGGIGIVANYLNEEKIFTPEQIAGMLFSKLKFTTEQATQTAAHDVVVSVPGYWGDSQRRALLDSIALGGLNCLRIVNDLTAASLSWGLYKTDLDEKEPKRVMIIDVGETAMSVGITEFTKSQAKVISTAYDFQVSGSSIDHILANHFADEFLQKKKIDLRQYPKSWFRLIQTVGKLKKQLNTAPSASLTVECVYEEFDITCSLTRDAYIALIKPATDAVQVPLISALKRANLQLSDIHQIEVIGSASRTMPIQTAIAATMGKELSFTMNAEEATAKGCALQCAILSPLFKVREYQLIDLTDVPIGCTWYTIHDPNDTSSKHLTLFTKSSVWPATKNINFARPGCKPFEIKFHYEEQEEPTHVNGPAVPIETLATVTVANVPQPTMDSTGVADIRLKVRTTGNGILEVVECELVEKYEEIVPAPAAAPAAPATESTETPPAADGQAPTDANAAPPAAAEEPKKVKKVKHTPVSFQVLYAHKTSESTMKDWKKIEAQMAEQQKIAKAISDAKNAVEAYVYDARDRLYDTWSQFVVDADKDVFNRLLEEVGDWLYGEGDDQPKEVYEAKLLSLKSLGDPVANRVFEHEARPNALANFNKVVDDYTAKLADTTDKYEHISAEDKGKIAVEIEKAKAWIEPLLAKQNAAKLSDDPFLYTRDINAKADAMCKFADPILNKPKPKPKPAPAPAATPEQPTPAANGEAKMDVDPNSAPNANANASAETESAPADMEVD